MKKFMQKRLKNEKGMTLIELLAVIVIIAIIAAIAIPAISNIIENSRVGAAKSDALSAFAAAELYLAENGDAFTAAGVGDITTAELTGGGYLDDLGSFELVDANGAVGPSFTSNADGDLLLSGTAINGGVKVEFALTSEDAVQALANGDDSAATGDDAPPATITVTR
ncbi:prepilin-type N-terminal cleavage/methylation domain-containing protein [Planococcus beigongshangi]|uniref:prepilin-type N-terminal cleavage/methylation domain-containing protein n=1 Tax=Planococcus beigongshangi TaxID=2782536 RepID=UPI00193B9AF1|nr:prepilin-type N-terminal cleavage/methylation domain-containing protein [Planococcus beigongshangi]